ncbi:hypothetical protein AF62_05610 [Streptococcus uberis C8329]|nr:hypothetical protein AF62_05610 [Streptococcus uberis C8329]KKF54499.1 hypothetical protein AF66_08155 [Streptococcus uberis B190]KKF58120.1 hypothetical protein AF69_03955 [Streptococcus uberis 6736]
MSVFYSIKGFVTVYSQCKGDLIIVLYMINTKRRWNDSTAFN